MGIGAIFMVTFILAAAGAVCSEAVKGSTNRKLKAGVGIALCVIMLIWAYTAKDCLQDALRIWAEARGIL